jgi:hypothetical protein
MDAKRMEFESNWALAWYALIQRDVGFYEFGIKVMPGLDKGLKGTCDGELRRIEVPWRLSRKRKSKGLPAILNFNSSVSPQ